jgi:hypothetical protein
LGEVGQNWTSATQPCPGVSVVQVLDGTLYTPTGCTTTERTVTPPVLVMVTRTIGMGQYGGGVEGNFAVDGSIRKLAVVATVGTALGAAVVGGLVAGGVVGLVGGGG